MCGDACVCVCERCVWAKGRHFTLVIWFTISVSMFLRANFNYMFDALASHNAITHRCVSFLRFLTGCGGQIVITIIFHLVFASTMWHTARTFRYPRTEIRHHKAGALKLILTQRRRHSRRVALISSITRLPINTTYIYLEHFLSRRSLDHTHTHTYVKWCQFSAIANNGARYEGISRARNVQGAALLCRSARTQLRRHPLA